MVEGPGATRNARKLQPCIGSTVVKNTDVADDFSSLIFSATTADYKAIQNDNDGKHVVDAFSVGKEVFLVFADESALRLHFGMNGCLWLQQDGIQTKNTLTTTNYSRDTIRSMHLVSFDENNNNVGNASWTIVCRGTTISTVTARVANSKRNRLAQRDVCAEDNVFNADNVFRALQKRSTAMISDVLLDQDCFPGVGNIIKIEGLHRAQVHPKRTVASLSDEELSTIILQCRLYARQWLKAGRAPAKHVYNQTICQTCRQVSVLMAKMGQDLSRVTFWCNSCQPWQKKTATTTTVTLTTTRTTSTSTGQKRPAASIMEPLTNVPSSEPKVARTMPPPPSSVIGKTACCPGHGIKCTQLKRVRKQGANQNRIFYVCRASGCSFFAWADSHLPTCCGGQKMLLRISKTEKTGGKWFLSCKKCSSFSWASTQQLAPLQECLTPLL